MKFLILVFVFALGWHAGRWDATHGYETGLHAGQWMRAQLIALGVIDCTTDSDCEGIQ